MFPDDFQSSFMGTYLGIVNPDDYLARRGGGGDISRLTYDDLVRTLKPVPAKIIFRSSISGHLGVFSIEQGIRSR